MAWNGYANVSQSYASAMASAYSSTAQQQPYTNLNGLTHANLSNAVQIHGGYNSAYEQSTAKNPPPKPGDLNYVWQTTHGTF